MLIAQRLERVASQGDHGRSVIARYLLTQEVPGDSTMAEVAAGAGVSKASLTRFAQALGYAGWPEFFGLYRFERERQAEQGVQVDHSMPFSANAPTEEYIESVARVRAESTRETAELQDPRAIEAAVGMIAGARRLLLYGISINALCFQLFQRKLLQLGMDAVLPPQAEMGLVTETVRSGDVVVAISYSGEGSGRVPMTFVEELRSRGARVVALTSEGPNYLREHADVALSILSRESLYAKIGTFSTEASIECLLDILYAGIFVRRYRENLELKTAASRAVERNRLPDDVSGAAEASRVGSARGR